MPRKYPVALLVVLGLFLEVHVGDTYNIEEEGHVLPQTSLIQEETSSRTSPPRDETVLNSLTFDGKCCTWWHRTGGDAGVVAATNYKALKIAGADHGSGRARWVRMWDTVSIEGRLNFGKKFCWSGVGDHWVNDDWLRMTGVYPGKANRYYGGYAAHVMWSHAYYGASDVNMKENIESLPGSAMDRIHALNPVYYDWTQEAKAAVSHGVTEKIGRQLGLLAQEVAEVVPEAVGEGANGRLAVNYHGLIPAVVEGIKEHHDLHLHIQSRLAAQKEKNFHLESKLQDQRSRIEALEKKLAMLSM